MENFTSVPDNEQLAVLFCIKCIGGNPWVDRQMPRYVDSSIEIRHNLRMRQMIAFAS